ncbi:putative DNA-binding protein [Klebsiella pneumoniae]|nr:putative DNA-binding protein [Klebsiella pneumoniae]
MISDANKAVNDLASIVPLLGPGSDRHSQNNRLRTR